MFHIRHLPVQNSMEKKVTRTSFINVFPSTLSHVSEKRKTFVPLSHTRETYSSNKTCSNVEQMMTYSTKLFEISLK